MENMALVSTKFCVAGSSSSAHRHSPPYPSLPTPARRRDAAARKRVSLTATAIDGRSDGDSWLAPKSGLGKASVQGFSNMFSSTNGGTTSNSQFLVPPPSSSIGSPIFWIGVGVGLSALFSIVTTRVKRFMMQRALNSMIGQMASENSPFQKVPNVPCSSPYPTQSEVASTASQQISVAHQPVVDNSVSSSEAVHMSVDASGNNEPKEVEKKYAFVDVSLDNMEQKDPSIQTKRPDATFSKDIEKIPEVSPNGAAIKQDLSAFQEQSQSRKSATSLSIDALEKMMEDPTVQKMIYPYLPEEMRNPTTFKWMLSNPQYRQQLQDMLNMGGSGEWDNRVMETLKSFDLNSPEMKKQFEQIGLTPEEIFSKVIENPDIAMAFQNPKIQSAIMEMSQNPLSFSKYQNDAEIMNVFQKLSEIFPGMS